MQPNYIAQINQFHRWLETHYLSPNAQLLWFKMIGLFNSCGWADRVQVDTRRLMTMIGVEDRRAAYRARDALVQAGLLEHQKGKKGCPSFYRMLYFRYGIATENGTENGTEYVTENGQKTVHINKQKQNENQNKNNIGNIAAPEEIADAWDAYVQMRDTIRKPVTGDAAKMLLDALEEMAPRDPARQRAILNRSTMHGWQGLFPLPDAPQETPRSYDIEQMERQLWDNPIVRGMV